MQLLLCSEEGLGGAAGTVLPADIGVLTGQPGEGTATINGTMLTFAPGADFQDLAEGETRDVTVQVTATDAHGATAVNDVTVTVTGVNDAPVTDAEDVTTDEDVAINIDVLDGDTDVVCADIMARASLALDPALRVFCAARAGAWDQAPSGRACG